MVCTQRKDKENIGFIGSKISLIGSIILIIMVAGIVAPGMVEATEGLMGITALSETCSAATTAHMETTVLSETCLVVGVTESGACTLMSG